MTHASSNCHIALLTIALLQLACALLHCELSQSALGMQMMQEWLGQHKLDRKALAVLAGNAQAVQLYDDYLRTQVQDVMEDLLAEFDESPPVQGEHTEPIRLLALHSTMRLSMDNSQFSCCCDPVILQLQADVSPSSSCSSCLCLHV